MITGVLPIELDIKILGYLSFSELLNLYYNAYWMKVPLKEEIHKILLKRCEFELLFSHSWHYFLSFRQYINAIDCNFFTFSYARLNYVIVTSSTGNFNGFHGYFRIEKQEWHENNIHLKTTMRKLITESPLKTALTSKI